MRSNFSFCGLMFIMTIVAFATVIAFHQTSQEDKQTKKAGAILLLVSAGVVVLALFITFLAMLTESLP